MGLVRAAKRMAVHRRRTRRRGGRILRPRIHGRFAWVVGGLYSDTGPALGCTAAEDVWAMVFSPGSVSPYHYEW